MHGHAEIVRSILSWAIRIVDTDDSRLPGPQLSQMQLGRMLSRADARTCHDIAREILVGLGREPTDERVQEMAIEIRRGWVASSAAGGRSASRRDSEAVILASRATVAMRRYGRPDERHILEVGSTMKTWKSMEERFRGKPWFSIRDDFERAALGFWAREHGTLLEISEWLERLTRR